MKKLIVVITAAVAVAIGAAWFYLRKPAEVPAPVKESSAPEAASLELPTTLPFDANDNLDQALDDLQALDEAGF